MAYGIGIDTGGTYTDAVIYDFDQKKVLAKGKSPTTRNDLSLGIGRALDMLPEELTRRAELVALSTTLATNACVENRGGRAHLVLMGTNRKNLEWIGADKKYGIDYDHVLCLDTRGSFDGTEVEHPDWERVMAENDAFFAQAQALSVAELNAVHNGAVCETAARDALKQRYDVPIVLASELVSGLNVIERGATAMLNARLLPVVEQFMQAVTRAIEARGLKALKMIVRSDGSLMSDELARSRPVETILSGPAASVMGSRALSDCGNCMIVDMGGTTTDISIVRGGAPQMSGGIRIGGWRTQIRGVYIDTFGLGGDTRLYTRDGQLKLDYRRVEPICALAQRCPRVKEDLKRLLENACPHTKPLHEFLYLTHMPEHPEHYTSYEQELIEKLSDGPQMIGGSALNKYGLNSERLEQEGIVMRCGLTPTDIMHIRGDYSCFDAEAAQLAVRYFLRVLPDYDVGEASRARFCEDVYTLVKKRLFENIARVFIESSYPEICKGGIDGQLQALIDRKWEMRDVSRKDDFFSLSLDVPAALVGLGAPTHIFLPDVAAALGARCIIPEHSEVANAVGAIVADIRSRVKVEIRADYTPGGLTRYSVHAPGLHEVYEEYEDALTSARENAKRLAADEARRRGAMGELNIRLDVNAHVFQAADGVEVDLGTSVVATATGRMGV